MPMPDSGPLALKRIALLRQGSAALARASAHESRASDGTLLARAPSASPLVHWAMRYGAAILSVDHDDLPAARSLLEGAPAWPDESCFSGFHRDIVAELARREQSFVQ